MGSGGSAYDATIKTAKTGDNYTSDATGLTLINHAYANTPYGFDAGDTFTIVVRGRFAELNTNKYQRMFRTDVDTPCGFYSYTAGYGMGIKLAGVSQNGFTVHDNRATTIGDGGASLNTAYIAPDKLDATELHQYVIVGTATKMYYYLDGVLIATQNASALKASSTLTGLGDNDPSAKYYAAKVFI
jgi:hypothetical protein